MSIAKLDLYNPEWLELVFEKRNHAYGAYDLRKHYAGNMVKAMAIAFFSVAFLYTGYSIFLKAKPAEVVRTVPFDPVIPIPPTTKPPVVIPPRLATSTPHQPATTVRYPELVVTHDRYAENPPKITELETAAISTQTSKGKDEGINVDIPETGPGSAEIGKETESTDVKDWTSVEVLPTPYGGAAAWSKFLQKNIHYPARASEE